MVGLHIIEQYIDVRRQMVANFIVHWPIFDIIKGAERQHGTTLHQYWWDQDFDLDLALSSHPDNLDNTHEGD